jgi:hypothetical protein
MRRSAVCILRHLVSATHLLARLCPCGHGLIARMWIVLISLLFFAGCDDALAGIKGVFVTRPVQRVLVSVLLDTSEGSSGTSKDKVLALLDVALPFAADHQGKVRIYTLEGPSARLVAEYEASPPAQPTKAAKDQARQAFLEKTKVALDREVDAWLAQRDGGSRITSGLTKVGLSGVTGFRHIVLVLSDLRVEDPVTNIHLECQPIPKASEYLATEEAAGNLGSQTLENIAVFFAFFEPATPVENNRCPQPNSRYFAIRALFDQATRNAGGRPSFHTQNISREDLEEGLQ